MTGPPAPAPTLRCSRCPATTLTSPQAAVFGLGWRTADGVLCPRCAGDEPAAGAFGVTCRTCDWTCEQVDGDQPMSRQLAAAVGAGHVCEPDVGVYPVSGAPVTVTVQAAGGLL